MDAPGARGLRSCGWPLLSPKGVRKWEMTKGFQNRGAIKSELLFGIITPAALTGNGNILKTHLGDYFSLV